jgi:hypothetical protein
MRIHKGGQDGFVALLASILISLLLIIVTVSMVALEATQLRTAEDSEQSMRAYYTAEAGTEDAVAKILSKAISTATPQLCPSAASQGAAYGPSTNWTCQQITFSGQPVGNLKADQAVTINPGTGPNFQSVEIEWNQSTDAVAGHYDMNLAGGFPTAAQFAANQYAAPPIELQIVQYPNGGFSENDVCSGLPTSCDAAGLNSNKEAFLQNALISPGGSGAGTGAVDYTTLFQNPNTQLGNCTPAPRTGWGGAPSSYNCYVILQNLPPARNFLFRIRSRYADSSYRFTFWSNPNGAGAQVAVAAGVATIDVTAQAGQVYRRVISDFPLGTSAASGLNYVMYSDTNVCKNFDVIDNAPPPSICP